MARLYIAKRDGGLWTLSFEGGLHKRLRVGGDFAGHDSKEDLKTELRRMFWEQEQERYDEAVAHDLQLPLTCASPSPLPCASSDTNTKVVKDANAGKRRKVCLDHGKGDHYAPVTYSTRSAERKSILEATEKQALAVSEKRRMFAAKKKQKLASDHELYASGIRSVVTRSNSNV